MNPRVIRPLFLGFTLTAAALLLAISARAEVKLHGLFTDNMILQRDASVPIWGWAEEGEQVTVQFRGQKASTKAKDGIWVVRLKRLRAGGPDDLKVTGRNSITLRGVLVGEVWVASGQSNMEWPMRATYDATNEIAKTSNPNLRLYTVPKLKAEVPTNNITASWQPCNSSTTPGFSAVAYYFARDLQKALGVPVGIIHTSWGGSPAEVWIREQVLATDKDFQRDILDPWPAQKTKTDDAIAAWTREKAEATEAGQNFQKQRPGYGWRPSELYNGMIAPVIPYAIKGAIWYQGESNAGRAYQYRKLFPIMVQNWRYDWDQGNFPFLQVQLAPFMAIRDQPTNSTWAELREAQNYATKALPKVGVAVITDVGDEKDIHPRKKEPVGARLALAARHVAYGERVTWSGPAYRSMKTDGDKVILRFNQTGLGLEARGGELKGFAIAGEDRKFVWAKAEISGNKVIVSSPEVKKPVAVRYGWADFPVVNLWNKDGLPASPFRTDQFPMITEPKDMGGK